MSPAPPIVVAPLAHPSPSSSNSPMSDYFTEDSMSPVVFPRHGRRRAQCQLSSPGLDMILNSAGADPSSVMVIDSAKAEILYRLGSTAQQLMNRDEPDSQLVAKLNFALDQMEAMLAAPEAQSKQPTEYHSDTDDFGGGVEPVPVANLFRRDSHQESERELESKPKMPRLKASGDPQLLIQRITNTNAELRRRFNEVRQSNAQAERAAEESAKLILRLRSCRSLLHEDLSNTHTDLVFLKLQLRNLESNYQPGLRHLARSHYWARDWVAINQRLRHRLNILATTLEPEDGRAKSTHEGPSPTTTASTADSTKIDASRCVCVACRRGVARLDRSHRALAIKQRELENRDASDESDDDDDDNDGGSGEVGEELVGRDDRARRPSPAEAFWRDMAALGGMYD